jgi:hypothetical protein
MKEQIIDFLSSYYPVLSVLLLVNAAFLAFGYFFASITRKSTHEQELLAAHQEGYEAAQKEIQGDKRAFSEDITGELAKLRDGIINSAKAYRDTLNVIESRVGFSIEDKDRLLIGKAVAADPTLALLDSQETPRSIAETTSSLQPSNDDQQVPALDLEEVQGA